MSNVIFDLAAQGLSTVKISKTLMRKFDFMISRWATLYILKKRDNPKPRRKTPQTFTDLHVHVMDFWLSINKDLTARNIQRKFLEEFQIKFSFSQITFYRRQLN